MGCFHQNVILHTQLDRYPYRCAQATGSKFVGTFDGPPHSNAKMRIKFERPAAHGIYFLVILVMSTLYGAGSVNMPSAIRRLA